MKILIVAPKMQIYGGAELLIVKLANYLTQNHVPNGLLTTALLPEIERDLTGTHIIRCPFAVSEKHGKILNFAKIMWHLNRGLGKSKNDYDVINVHNFPAEMTVFPYKKPVVWMCNEPPEIDAKIHEQQPYGLNWLLIKCLLAVDRLVVRHYIAQVVVADEFNYKRFQALYGVRPSIISYGVEYDFFESEPSATSDKSSNRFTVLHVGMLTPLKNQLESIKTIEKLKEEIPGINLILAGQGEQKYLIQINAYIKSHHLEPYVQITGHVTRERLKTLYHQSDVLLHPIGSQGGWLSPFEALCAKLPIIVSPEMTASEMIRAEGLGIVSKDYAAAVRHIYENQNDYKKRAIQQAYWVKNNLSWNRFGENMLRIFEKALEKRINATMAPDDHIYQ